ncbi:hypothetical protein SFRURICE_015693 [Spodoptera frugiperda]|uniref:Pre-mRNA-splicing factor ATP-dependent RNA helicase PRP16 n=1 Tax=Spodoptera frugiperda TaxID=7108 RepID=A0A2H1VQE3_SPOFR|nr:pre-mRNA-splicing factor ATP-dependent RNA helicase PRP16 [Spodoptera frugiperda]KAF9813204.1 hypothetical protein SFRURICE_015693 [Spodoptera frugiperda]
MALKFVAIGLGLLQLAVGLPTNKANTLEDLLMVDDTISVGSFVRETRAAAPDDWHKSVQNEGDGEIGYSRKKSGGGKKGYQMFDAYHKKAGDHYEFEKQDSYGQEEKGQDGAYSDNYETLAEREPDHEEYEDEERPRKQKQKQKKQRKEISHSELKEGADDGNGGVEAFGHDPRDYILPERYTWGEEEESESE